MHLHEIYSEEFSFSQEDVIRFSEITGDTNPIHLDPEYAATTRFQRPIMHGFLGGSVISRILGTAFPGKGTIYLSQTLKFLAPMYVGTPYRITLTVTEIQPERGKATLLVEITDSITGNAVLSGEAKVMNTDVIKA